MNHLPVLEIMEVTPATLTPETSVQNAMEIILKKKIAGAPVIDKKQQLVGMLSEKDCLKIVSAEAFDGLPTGQVADYMSTIIKTVSPETSIYEMVHIFVNSPFRYLPVVDKDLHLLGFVSRQNVLKAINSMKDNPPLYGTPQTQSQEETSGVDSAMRRARGQ